MPGLGARLVVYGFFGAFGVLGVLFLVLAVQSTLASAEFLHSARHTQGIVTELRPVRSSRTGAGTVVPVFRFQANDGRDYLGFSNVSVRWSAFRVGDRVGVLYLKDQPGTARIDMFPAFWTGSLVLGIVGGAFSAVAGFAVIGFLRMRRAVRNGSPGSSRPLVKQ
jgi:hypothetical protein